MKVSEVLRRLRDEGWYQVKSKRGTKGDWGTKGDKGDQRGHSSSIEILPGGRGSARARASTAAGAPNLGSDGGLALPEPD